MSQFDHKAPAFLAGVVPLNPGEAIAYWTGKTLHATAGTRSAVNADCKVGNVVMLEAEKHDKTALASQYTKPQDILIVGQPTTTDLTSGRFIVNRIISSDINEIPDPVGASTQRRGGYIVVQVGPGEVLANIPDSTSAKAVLAVGNGVDNLIADPGVGNRTQIRQGCATALEANSSGGVALRRVWFWGA